MSPAPARFAFALPLLLAFVSCGDQSVFLSAKSAGEDLQIVSASDGQVFASGKSIPLMVSAPDASSSKDVEIEATVSAPDGTSVWHNRAAAVLNEQSPITLPANLPSGLYRLDLVLYSSGQVSQKKSVSFFVAPDGWKITGIRSFPPVITAAATVMLKAELDIPTDANPWLRWSWKDKVLQKGLLSAGMGQILWDVPGEGGVYTVTLELFPSAPASGSDFSFRSSLSLSTDIIVGGGDAQPDGRLGPPASFLTLLHLQGSLADAGAGAKKAGKPRAEPVGAPAVVSVGNGFGYQLDGSTGITVPWLALPVTGGALGPFTISLGVSFDDAAGAGTIVNASTADGSFSVVLSMSTTSPTPQATLTSGGGAPVVVPWGGAALGDRQRHLLSFSLTPGASSAVAQWYLDGVQVSRTEVPATVGAVSPDGSITIGGPHGFHGIVDEFGVYAFDSTGKPSTDPDLFLRSQTGQYGSRLVFADGFDGHALPGAFAVENGGRLSGGSLDLPPGASLVLPPVRTGTALTVTAGLAAATSRAAALVAEWQGAAQPAATVPLGAVGTELKFQLSADGRSLVVSGPGGDATAALAAAGAPPAALVLRIENPANAKSDLLLASVLAVK
ncbi:MAG TPA: hypothetical protein VFI08_05775 [Spirochaetia bacterium]|nr:hypothetical protein [Spirochaetia bacterium]